MKVNKQSIKKMMGLLLVLMMTFTPILSIEALAEDPPASPTTYAVAIDSGITGGAVTADLSQAEEGQTVTLTVTPNTNFLLKADSLRCVASDGGSPVDITTVTAGTTYTFMMPASAVTATAAFEWDPAVTIPATSATVAFTAETASVSPAASITANVGDTVTVKAKISAVGGIAYGFTGGFTYAASNLQFLSTDFASDNSGLPGITVQDSATPGTLRISVDSNGTTPLLAPDKPQTVIFKFKVKCQTTTAQTVSFGARTTATRVTLLNDPTVRIADLQDTSGNFYTVAQLPAGVSDKTLVVQTVTSATINTASGFDLVLEAQSSFGSVSTSTSTASPLDLGVKVGDTVTFKATISTSVPGKQAYGFTASFYKSSTAMELDTAAFAIDNPGVTVDTTENPYYTRVYVDSNGSTPVVAPGQPKVITFKYIVRNMNNGTVNMQIGGKTTAFRLSLLTDPTARIADLKDTSTPPAYIASPDSLTQAAKEKTAFYEKTIAWFRFTTSSGVTSTLARDASEISGGTAVPVHIGERATVNLTITSDTDAYGFGVAFDYLTSLLEWDTSALAADNPGMNLAADLTASYPRLVWESNGTTKAITAGTPLTVKLRFKLVQTNVSALNLNIYGNAPLTVFTDPTVRAYGTSGLFAGTTATTWLTNIQAAEKAGKVKVANPPAYPGLGIQPAFNASVVFSQETGKVGTNPTPVTATATITGPTDKAVYGLSTGLTYSGAYLVFDQALTAAANPGLTMGFGSLSSPTSQYGGTIQQIYVESDGSTPIIAAGGTLNLKLVFVPAGGASSSNISAAISQNNRMVLFTDPSIRAAATGTGLTTLNFLNDNIIAAEKALKVTICGVTAGKVTTTARWTDLTLDSSGYYTLSTADAMQKFANHVNVDGDNMIKGNIAASMTLTDFAGIGTVEYPFRGELKASSTSYTVTLNRTVSAGNNQVIGGLVKYLGSGGLIDNLTVGGSINVSGTTGAASIGGIVGKSDGGNISYCTSNVAITAAPGVIGNVGGVVGTANKGNITNATVAGYNYALYQNKNAGAISGGTNVGGIAGAFNGVPDDTSTANTIALCSNSGAISGGDSVGGTVGKSTGGVIATSGNGVWVTNQRTNGGHISGSSAVGGAVGTATNTAIKNCYNTGAISDGAKIGGIVGYVDGATAVTESWNSAAGTVTSVANADVGGIIGEIGSAGVSSTYNFNLGAVSAGGTASYVGGVTGRAVATPTKYKSNYYLTSTASADGLDSATFGVGSAQAVGSTIDRFLFTGASASAPGKYSYQPGEPEKDTDGTYLLKMVEDLLWFTNTVNNNTATTASVDGNEINGKLMNNIDLSDEQFYGIGDSAAAKQYNGTFDGNGKTVTLNLSGTNAGFFNYIGANGEVKNLTIAGKVSGERVAGVVYSLSGGKLTNCVNTATVTGTTRAAGIAVEVYNATLTGCKNNGTITAPNGTAGGGGAGGIAVQAGGKSSFISCENSGNVSAPSTVGGIVATAPGGGTDVVIFKNCTNSGSVTSTAGQPNNNTLQMQLYFSAGGILGVAGAGQPVIFDGCTNRGDISAGVHAGGILGAYDSGTSSTSAVTITDSANYGDISITYNGNDPIIISGLAAGGIAGALNVSYAAELINGVWVYHEAPISIHRNYNEGNVNGGMGTGASSIVGRMGAGEQYDNTVTNNKTTVLVGNDASNTRITKVDPPVNTPSGGNTPGGNPSGGNPTGGSTPSPTPTAVQEPDDETTTGTGGRTTINSDTVPLEPIGTENPESPDTLPSQAPQTAPEQGEEDNSLDVDSDVTEVKQQNILPAILLIATVVLAAGVMIFLGLRKKKNTK